jgi:hypothetical protein
LGVVDGVQWMHKVYREYGRNLRKKAQWTSTNPSKFLKIVFDDLLTWSREDGHLPPGHPVDPIWTEVRAHSPSSRPPLA